jgi:60S ribosomal subunit assembly/export protein LOC1
MAPSKTRTIKNKHAGPKGSAGAAEKGGAKRSATDGVSKPKSKKPKGPVVSQQVKEKNRALLMKRPKRKKYTAEELGIPTLNMITPIGVEKPKGKKKGKVFVDDKVRFATGCELCFFYNKSRMLIYVNELGEHDDNSQSRPGREGRPH